MSPTVRIKLLGNFTLIYGEEPVTGVNAPRLQSLLAYLLLRCDEPQSRQRLAFLLWPDSSESQARNNLRQTLHALRLAWPAVDSFLHADASTLRWRPGEPYQVDVAAFEEALELADSARREGRPEAERDALAQAVSLYGADLLPGCYDDWITAERERLRLLYLQALGHLIELLEAQGDLAAAMHWSHRFIAYDPLNESGCRRLMRLLAATGDRIGAIRAYHTHASGLERELGVAPSAESRDMYERLLGAAGETAADAEPQPVSNAAHAFVGREREWDRLRESWRRAVAGESAFALIVGEAGIGKTRFSEEMLVWTSQQGATTARARCYAAEGRLSLAPVTEWLRSDGVRPYLSRLEPVWLTEVSRLLPELASEYPSLPPHAPIVEYGHRQRFFEALARAVLAAPQPLSLFIDDLQWCDQETLEWLHFLLRFDAAARLLVIGAARDDELPADHPLPALLHSLRHRGSFSEIALQPLDAAETARLASALANHELNVATAMRLYHETEGNPLFVIETIRAAAQKAPEGMRDDAPGDSPMDASPQLPPRVRAVIAARLAQLSPQARELASLAATIGREFRLDVLLRASKGDEDDIVRALDELWRRRIVRDQLATTYDFTHDKLREVAYGETSLAQRRLNHRRIAQALRDVDPGDTDPVSGQIASHFDRAGLVAEALPFYYRAAETAREVYANDDSIAYLVRALELMQGVPAGAARDAQELQLLMMLAPIYRITRGWTAPELERVLQRCLQLSEQLGAVVERADALYGWESLLIVQAQLEQVQVIDKQVRALYEQSQREPPPLSAVMVAGARLHLGHVAEADALFETVITEFDTKQAKVQQDALGWNLAVHSRAWQSHSLWCRGYPDRALERATEAVRLGVELDLPFNQALAATYLAMLQQLRADKATAEAHAEEANALTVEYRAPYYRSWAAILLSYASAVRAPGRGSLTALRQAIEQFKSSGARLRLPYYLALLASSTGRAGHISEALGVVDEAMDTAQLTGERWWDAELYRLRGRLLQTLNPKDEAAERALLQAVEVARAQDAKSLELRAVMSLARRWMRHDRADDARSRLREIFSGFTEGFETPDLRAARSLLDKLA